MFGSKEYTQKAWMEHETEIVEMLPVQSLKMVWREDNDIPVVPSCCAALCYVNAQLETVFRGEEKIS